LTFDETVALMDDSAIKLSKEEEKSILDKFKLDQSLIQIPRAEILGFLKDSEYNKFLEDIDTAQ